LKPNLPDRASLVGVHVVVTSGGTREPIDPVRYLGNRSSGKMGDALATVAHELGAGVTLITTIQPSVPAAVRVVNVETADEMLRAVRSSMSVADVLLMAAAVADYRPKTRAPSKLKKRDEPWTLTLVPTVDILASLRDEPARTNTFVVGFAAETDDLLSNAEQKLRAKGLDLIVLNDVGRRDIGMGADHNAVTVIDSRGVVAQVARAPKREVAAAILRIVAARVRP